jgi:hypothetical protein
MLIMPTYIIVQNNELINIDLTWEEWIRTTSDAGAPPLPIAVRRGNMTIFRQQLESRELICQLDWNHR